MKQILDSEVFVDWIFMALFGVLFWILGRFDRHESYRISVPWWLALMCGRVKPKAESIGIYGFVSQVLGILWLVWATILALVVASHARRVDLYWGGVMTTSLLAGMLVLLKRFMLK